MHTSISLFLEVCIARTIHLSVDISFFFLFIVELYTHFIFGSEYTQGEKKLKLIKGNGKHVKETSNFL